jgi:hypothetical protein
MYSDQKAGKQRLLNMEGLHEEVSEACFRFGGQIRSGGFVRDVKEMLEEDIRPSRLEMVSDTIDGAELVLTEGALFVSPDRTRIRDWRGLDPVMTVNQRLFEVARRGGRIQSVGDETNIRGDIGTRRPLT